jgi:hypothetical protein
MEYKVSYDVHEHILITCIPLTTTHRKSGCLGSLNNEIFLYKTPLVIYCSCKMAQSKTTKNKNTTVCSYVVTVNYFYTFMAHVGYDEGLWHRSYCM